MRDIKLPNIYRPVANTSWADDVRSLLEPLHGENLSLNPQENLRLTLLRHEELRRIKNFGSRLITEVCNEIDTHLPSSFTEESHAELFGFAPASGKSNGTNVVNLVANLIPTQRLITERAKIKEATETALQSDQLRGNFYYSVYFGKITKYQAEIEIPVEIHEILPKMFTFQPGVFERFDV